MLRSAEDEVRIQIHACVHAIQVAVMLCALGCGACTPRAGQHVLPTEKAPAASERGNHGAAMPHQVLRIPLASGRLMPMGWPIADASAPTVRPAAVTPHDRLRTPITQFADALHDGVEIVCAAGTPVVATASGTVDAVGNESLGIGDYVMVRHSGGFTTIYGHLAGVSVTRGQSIARGERVGLAGSSGLVDVSGVLYALAYEGRTFSPTAYLYRDGPRTMVVMQ